MSFYEGLPFFLTLAILLIPGIVLGCLERRLRYYTLALSLFFLFLVLQSEPVQFFSLLLFYFWSLAVIRGYLFIRKRFGRKEHLYFLFLLLILLPLVLCKLSPLFSLSLFSFVGISYMSFRSTQIVIEIYDGLISQVPVSEFTGFLLFFPSVSSGPIDRSRRFHEDWERVLPRREYLDLLSSGIFRLLLGLVYKLVIASCLYKLLTLCDASLSAGSHTLLYSVLYAYLYGFYLFFDFAGYSLMAIGTAYLLGVKLPDNFRAPFISRDMKEFWDRWHITLSHWFRDFLFTRFIMRCTKKKWFSTRLQRAGAGFLLNMTVMGLWHGVTPSYLLYGVYHGVLLTCTEVYQKKSGFYKKYKNKPCYRFFSWLFTLQLVMFGFFIFSGKFLEVLALAF